MASSPSTCTCATIRPTTRPRPKSFFARCRTHCGRSARNSRPSTAAGAMPEEKPSDLLPGVLTEYLTDDTGFFVRSTREFEHFQSPFQAVEAEDPDASGATS